MEPRADRIERFLKEQLARHGFCEVQRWELAQHFGCVPSQITYVLATRFRVEQGYLVESRRGGGGHIRIRFLTPVAGGEGREDPGAPIGEQEGDRILERMATAGVLTLRERRLLDRLLRDRVLGQMQEERDRLRGRLLRAVLDVLKEEAEER